MKTVLAFCISGTFSGGERYTLELLSALKELGWAVSVVGSGNARLKEESAARDIQYVESGLAPKLGKRTALQVIAKWRAARGELDQIVTDHRPSLVLLQYKKEQVLWGGRSWPADVVMLEHGPIPKWIRRVGFLRRAYSRALSSAGARVAVSSPAAEDIRAWGVDAQIIGAGVHLTEAAVEARASYLGSADMRGSRKTAVYAGRLTEEKGVLAAARALAGNPEIHLRLVGAGPAAKRLNLYRERFSNIQVDPPVRDALPTIAQADVGLLLTRDPGEGLPLFALECVALGVPVIGLAGSPAMKALSEDMGSRVQLLDSLEGHALEEAIRAAVPLEPLALSWQSVAWRFVGAVSGVRR